ncbi:MAG: hypothetical protein FWE46_04040 [Coriobacteriia bacterium]|nr:hypothetical protein [Coriobacteriia bacterium]MCL2537202.1 hypothetical protein [Coriobacteriia bacterium]
MTEDKRALFTLTPAESKRLIAKAVAVTPEVTAAMKSGMIVIGAGTTNAFVLEELTGKKVDAACYTAGIITAGRQCVTAADMRTAPAVLIDGRHVDMSWEDAVEKMTAGDVFIKGGNAIDPERIVGVMMAHPEGGTIGKALPILVARGVNLLLPVGLEKLIPDVNLAAQIAGINTFDKRIGFSVGVMPVSYGLPITEEDAIFTLFDSIAAFCIGAGGIGGSEGSVTLVTEGPEADIDALFELIKSIKGEKPLSAHKQRCSACANPCDYPGNN